MRLITKLALGLAATATAALGQTVTPQWVQHVNGEVNVDPANRLPILRKNVGGHESQDGTSTMVSFGKMLRYDATRYLLMVRENGIAEASASEADKALAQQYPDRSLIWIEAATGKSLGLAHVFGVQPITVTGQGNNLDFFTEWGIDDGQEGSRALYSTHKNVILRWAPKAGGGWESTPTCAWVEPTDAAKDCSNTDLDGTSTGDGNQSWRWRDFRVTGGGVNTVIMGGGGTWRASMHPQIFTTTDGLKFTPVSRVNDRDGGIKTRYSLGGLSSRVVAYGLDAAHPNLQTFYHGHYPGTGWESRPDRYINNPDSPFRTVDDTYATGGLVSMFESGAAWNESLSGNLSYPASPAGPNAAWGNLPAYQWEAAGKDGLSLTHSKDGVLYYDGNWSCSLDSHSSLDYIVNYAMPSWNVQFGSILKPGWIGVHRLDGSIAANGAYLLPFNEMDVMTPDEGNVGNTWGYDGDVTLYPDSSAPANLKKSTLSWVGSSYGFGLFTIQNVSASVVTQPADTTITENQQLTLTAEISGSPNTYQWYKDGVALDGTKTANDGSLYYPKSVVQGVTKPTLVIPMAAVGDTGKYKLVAVNPLGGVTTREAQVTVQGDVTAPTVAAIKIGRSADTTYIRIDYSEMVTEDTAGNPANYTMSGNLKVNGARVIGTSAVVIYTDSITPGAAATLTINGVKDISSHANPIAANTQKTVYGPVLTAGAVLWELWPGITGTSVDDLVADPNYPGMPTRWEYMTSWNTDANSLSGVAETYGSRSSGWITPTETGSYRFFIGSDDASSLYMNTTGPGTDAASITTIAWELSCCHGFVEPYNPANPDVHPEDPAGNGSKLTSDAIPMTAGRSYYIYLVMKEGGGGDWSKVAWRKEGDTTAAASLAGIPGAVLSSYAPVPAPKFNAPVVAGGQITLTWSGFGTLFESSDLKSWSAVSGNPASGVSLPASAPAKFYKLVQ